MIKNTSPDPSAFFGLRKNVPRHGVVIDPVSLIEEFKKLEKQGIKVSPENLYISDRAQFTMLTTD